MSTLRILVLTDEIFPDGVGGIGKSLYNEAIALSKRSHHITVLVRSLRRDLPSETMLDAVHVVRFAGPTRASRLYHLYPLAIVYHVYRWLRRHSRSFDVIYALNPLHVLPLSLLGRRLRLPVVYSFFSPISQEILLSAEGGKYGHSRWLGYIAGHIIGWIERFAFRYTAIMLPRSQFSRQILLTFYPEARIHMPLIALGVNTTQFAVTPKATARRRLELPPDRPILITVRRLESRMGLSNLIDAMTYVRETHPDVLLLIGGKGFLYDRLAAQIEAHDLAENVRLLGFISEEELPLYLAAANLFVLPTVMLEGFGLATIEALSAGTPVLGTPIGATPEILHPLEPALITRDASSAALAESISAWLNRPQDLDALAGRSRQYVEERFNIDVIAEQIEQVLHTTMIRHNS